MSLRRLLVVCCVIFSLLFTFGIIGKGRWGNLGLALGCGEVYGGGATRSFLEAVGQSVVTS